MTGRMSLSCVFIVLLASVPYLAFGMDRFLPPLDGQTQEGAELHAAVGLSALGWLDEHRRQVDIVMDRQRRHILEQNPSVHTVDDLYELYDFRAFAGRSSMTIEDRVEALSRYLRDTEMRSEARELRTQGVDPSDILVTDTFAIIHGYDGGAGRTFGGTVSSSVDLWSVNGRESFAAGYFLLLNAYGERSLLRLSLGNQRGRFELAYGVEKFGTSEFGAIVGPGSWVSVMYSAYGLSGNVILGGGRAASDEFRVDLPVMSLFRRPDLHPRVQVYFERVPPQRQRINVRFSEIEPYSNVFLDGHFRLQVSDEAGIDMRRGTAYGRVVFVPLHRETWHLRIGGGLSYTGDLTDRSYAGSMALFDVRLGPLRAREALSFGVVYSQNYYPTFFRIPDPDVPVIQVRYGSFP